MGGPLWVSSGLISTCEHWARRAGAVLLRVRASMCVCSNVTCSHTHLIAGFIGIMCAFLAGKADRRQHLFALGTQLRVGTHTQTHPE